MAMFFNSAKSLVVSPKDAKLTKQILERANLLDRSRCLQRTEHEVLIPIVMPVDQSGLDSTWKPLIEANIQFTVSDLETHSSHSLKPLDRLFSSLKTFVEGKGMPFTPEIKGSVCQSWEIHGDLALLPLNCFRHPLLTSLVPELWSVVAEALRVKRLARKEAPVNDDGFRTPQVSLLLGCDGWVTHTDNGIKYCYDVCSCMFSAGNITEKLRMAELECKDETIVDMYAGIGYFTLPLLVHGKANLVYACEWNPAAITALRRGLVENRVEGHCTVLQGDNRQVCPRQVADRVILGLIPSSEDGWSTAVAALKPSGGMLHIHSCVTSGKDRIPTKTEQLPFELTCDSKNIVKAGDIRSNNRVCSKCSGFRENTLRQSSPDSIHLDATNRPCLVNDPEDQQNVSTLANTNSNYVTPAQQNLCKSCICLASKVNAVSMNTGTEATVKSDSKSKKRWTKSCNIKKEWETYGEYVRTKIKEFLCDLHGFPWNVTVDHIEHVKPYAPHIDHLVIDVKCSVD